MRPSFPLALVLLAVDVRCSDDYVAPECNSTYELMTGPTLLDGRHASGVHCIIDAAVSCTTELPTSSIGVTKCGDDTCGIFDIGCGFVGRPSTSPDEGVRIDLTYTHAPNTCTVDVQCNNGATGTVTFVYDGCNVEPLTALVCDDDAGLPDADAGPDAGSDSPDSDSATDATDAATTDAFDATG